ncbi:hypothetical protein BV20DRAFT_72336 [Pilatotrama ljubarskyi]|nr:hypothetical protein BV20DRAFT_72336 [Pilatotrama ljubarskyi]
MMAKACVVVTNLFIDTGARRGGAGTGRGSGRKAGEVGGLRCGGDALAGGRRGRCDCKELPGRRGIHVDEVWHIGPAEGRAAGRVSIEESRK